MLGVWGMNDVSFSFTVLDLEAMPLETCNPYTSSVSGPNAVHEIMNFQPDALTQKQLGGSRNENEHILYEGVT